MHYSGALHVVVKNVLFEINVLYIFFLYIYCIFRGFYVTKLYLCSSYNPFIHFLSINHSM